LLERRRTEAEKEQEKWVLIKIWVLFTLSSHLPFSWNCYDAFTSLRVWSFLNFCLMTSVRYLQVFETWYMFTVFLNDCSQHSCYFFSA
jgi:RsiW-degrading membrane proteinase PrsW (M82 family)